MLYELFGLFVTESPYFHVCGIAPTNKIIKNVTLLELFGIPGGESSISCIKRGYDPALLL